ISGTDLLRHGKQEGSVTLTFTLREKRCIIKRTLKRRKDDVRQESGYIIEGEVKQELTPVELKARVIGLLGYPESSIATGKNPIFRYTVYTPQEAMKHILFDDKETRIDTLRKLFGVDRYKTVRENAQLALRFIREKTKELEGIVQDAPEKKKQLASYTQEHETLASQKNVLAQEHALLAKKLEECTQGLTKTEERIRHLAEQKSQCDICRSQLNDKKSRQKELAAAQKDAEERLAALSAQMAALAVPDESDEELEASIAKEEARLQRITHEMSLLEERIAAEDERERALKEEIAAQEGDEQKIALKKKEHEALTLELSKKKYTELEQKMKGLEEARSAQNKSLAALESKRASSEELTRRIASNIAYVSTCPTCLQEVSEAHKSAILAREQKNLEELASREKQVKTLVAIAEQGLEKARGEMEKKRALLEACAVLAAEIASLEERCARAGAKAAELARVSEKKARNHKLLSQRQAFN
ncbi:hypothetical protein COY95_03595, partial [Candidatus Woesearchaeota archaeon CG_4_10_14_0_8_um_filter_47_5]